MNINDTSELFNTLLNQADKKSEKKVYNCFLRVLQSLENKDLTENQSQLIQEKLSSFNLETGREDGKKIYKKKLSEFKAFLKDEFSFTHASYFTEIYMVYAMIFGTGIGLSIGSAVKAGIGTSIGLSMGTGIGMALGIVYGSIKDAEAKKQGLVI